MRERMTRLSPSFKIVALLFAAALLIVALLQYRWFSRSAYAEIDRSYRSAFSTVIRTTNREYDRYAVLLRDIIGIDVSSENLLKRELADMYDIYGPQGTTPFLLSRVGYLEIDEIETAYVYDGTSGTWIQESSYMTNEWDMKHLEMLKPGRPDIFPIRGFGDEGHWTLFYRLHTRTDLVISVTLDMKNFILTYIVPAVAEALPEYSLEWIDPPIVLEKRIREEESFNIDTYRFSLFRAIFGKSYLSEKSLFVPIMMSFNWREMTRDMEDDFQENRDQLGIPNPKGDPFDFRDVVMFVRIGFPDTIFAGGIERRLALTWLGVLLLLVGIGAAFLLLLNQVHRIRAIRTQERDFVASVTHELRTPLTVIQSAADNITNGVVPEERIKTYGNLIKVQTQRLAAMIEEMLIFSGLEGNASKAKEPVPLRFSGILDNCRKNLDTLASERGITLIWNTGGLPASTMGDPDALRMILENLITNAVYHAYSGSPGIVRITGWLKIPDTLVFTVEDEGRGISPAEQSKVFEPFYRDRVSRENQEKGSGLGLFIAYRKVTLMNGDLILESPYERIEGKKQPGCRFTLTLPWIQPVEEENCDAESPDH